MHETIQNRHTVFDGHLLRVEVVEVETANGRRSKRELVHHPGAVAVVPLRRAAHDPATWEVLLVRQYRLPAGEPILELVAGTAEPNEDAQTTAKRELAEEIKMRAETWHELGTFLTSPGYCDERIALFVALDLSSTEEGEADLDEAIDVVVMPLQDAIQATRDGRIQDLKALAGLLWAWHTVKDQV